MKKRCMAYMLLIHREHFIESDIDLSVDTSIFGKIIADGENSFIINKLRNSIRIKEISISRLVDEIILEFIKEDYLLFTNINLGIEEDFEWNIDGSLRLNKNLTLVNNTIKTKNESIEIIHLYLNKKDNFKFVLFAKKNFFRRKFFSSFF